MPEKEAVDPDFSQPTNPEQKQESSKEDELSELHPQAWNLLFGPCSRKARHFFPSFANQD